MFDQLTFVLLKVEMLGPLYLLYFVFDFMPGLPL